MVHLLTFAERDEVLTSYFNAMSDPVAFVPPSLDAWTRRAAELRPALANALGLYPLPERLPLDVHITGELDEGDYTVTRLYWQSWEGFYASGWLYRPKSLSAPAPAVLNPHGHWEHGARNPVVQSRLIGLAKKGYVALAVDSIHVTDFPIGLCSMTVMTWNNIRALDLLSSLEYVDATRIGCTGASGGGQQTMYVAALDDRIAATVNVCLVSYFKKILFPDERTHCICNHVPGLLALTDEPEVCALIAPRPSLYLCVTQDWTADFPREEYPEIARIYELYNARDKIDVQQWDWHHDYHQPMRERMYAWFNGYLRGITNPEAAREPEITPRTPEELANLSKPVPQARSWDEFPRYYRERRAFRAGALTCETLRRLLGRDKRNVPLPASVYQRANSSARVLRGATGFPIPCAIYRNDDAASARLAIVLHPVGKDAVDAELVRALRAKGWDVIAPDVRLRGELGIRWELNTTIWGRPEVGMAVDDVRDILDAFSDAGNGVRPKEIACVGIGEMGVVALATGALDARITQILCPDIGKTFADGRTDMGIPNLLRYGDLPNIVRLCLPRRVLVGVGADTRTRYETAGIPPSCLRPVDGEWIAWLES